MSAHDTTHEGTFEEDTFEEVKSEEDIPDEYNFIADLIELFESTPHTSEVEDINWEKKVHPEVKYINWEKKVHPDGLVEFFAELRDDRFPSVCAYNRAFYNLIYSFLREHEDKDVLMRFNYSLHFEIGHMNIVNSPFVKLEEHTLEETIEDLQSELTFCEIVDEETTHEIKFCYAGLSIIFKLKEKEHYIS